MFSLAGTLDAMRRHLPDALVSADAFEYAKAAVEHVAAEITSGIYFECRLQHGSPRVDLVIAVHADGGARLAATSGHEAPGCLHVQPAWRRLSAFCRRWTAPTSSLQELVDHLWLEYDVEQGASLDEATRSGPGVFCSLRDSHRMAHSGPTLSGRALRALEALAGRRAGSTVQDCLDACIARLPPETGVPHVGVMFGRETPTVRVCIAKLPAAGAAGFLAATAGVGGKDVADITRLASLPDGPAGPLYLPMVHLDIDERTGFVPRVGMERQFAHTCQLTGRTGTGERALLDALTARGLCAREKRDALLQWPGRSVAMLPHEIWWSVVERRVNHVKFVYEPASGVQTKGYLFARHRPCRAQPQPGNPAQTYRRQPSDSKRCPAPSTHATAIRTREETS